MSEAIQKHNPGDSRIKSLCTEVATIHEANMEAARRVASNISVIGIKLHQIKALVGHGQFEKEIAKLIPGLSLGARHNYMQLAFHQVLEHRIKTLLVPPGGKSSTVEDLENAKVLAPDEASGIALINSAPDEIREKAISEMETFDWLKPPFKLEKLSRQIEGKSIMEALRNYGVVRNKIAPTHTPPKPLAPKEELDAKIERANSLLDDLSAHMETAAADRVMFGEHITNAARNRLKLAARAIGACYRKPTKKKGAK